MYKTANKLMMVTCGVRGRRVQESKNPRAVSPPAVVQFDMVSSLATLLFLAKENCSEPIKAQS